MKKCLVIMNHRPTMEQIEGLEKQFGITELIQLPEELRPLWSQIPAEGTHFPTDHVQPILSWISKNANVGDYCWIQGEPAATVLLRNYTNGRGLVPILATSKREVEELRIGDSITKKSIFRHVNFRYYP